MFFISENIGYLNSDRTTYKILGDIYNNERMSLHVIMFDVLGTKTEFFHFSQVWNQQAHNNFAERVIN